MKDDVHKQNVNDLVQAYRRIKQKDTLSALGIFKERVQDFFTEPGYICLICSRTTMQVIESLGFQVISHPPYCSDLALCAFFLFLKLKAHLNGIKFDLIEKIWSVAQDEHFYSDGITKIVKR